MLEDKLNLSREGKRILARKSYDRRDLNAVICSFFPAGVGR